MPESLGEHLIQATPLERRKGTSVIVSHKMTNASDKITSGWKLHTKNQGYVFVCVCCM